MAARTRADVDSPRTRRVSSLVFRCLATSACASSSPFSARTASSSAGRPGCWVAARLRPGLERCRRRPPPHRRTSGRAESAQGRCPRPGPLRDPRPRARPCRPRRGGRARMGTVGPGVGGARHHVGLVRQCVRVPHGPAGVGLPTADRRAADPGLLVDTARSGGARFRNRATAARENRLRCFT